VRCFSLHLSCHHLQSEHIEVDGMNMSEMEDMNMMEEHDHPMNHRLGEEGMNMAEGGGYGGYPYGRGGGMNMVEERSSNHRPEVEGIDREDIDMMEDMTVEVEVIEREHESVVLVRHWTGDGVEIHR
jgi:hypothetical protein